MKSNNISDIVWESIFTRDGYPYFLFLLSFEGYSQLMKNKIGWSYRDQLVISKKNHFKVSGSERDQVDFKKFSNKKSALYFENVNNRILLELKKCRKDIIVINKLLLNPNNTEKALSLFYNSYKNLYSVYRFPTIFDLFYEGTQRRKFIRKFTHTKDLCSRFFNETDKQTLELIKINLSKCFNLPEYLVLYMTFEEIIKAFKNIKSLITKKELIERYNFYILTLVDGKINFYYGKEAVSLNEQLSFVNYSNNTDITGQIACSGMVRGKVKISYSVNDINNIKKGGVLVTPMTSVSYIPFLSRFSAIITNEGGATCHAAILSRELGIPCITGTKVATDVLKDGDMVEVDANKGIVKIIK